MNKPPADHISELGIEESREGVVSRFDPIDSIEALAIAQVNGSTVVPVQPVGLHPGVELVFAQWPILSCATGRFRLFEQGQALHGEPVAE